MNIRTSSTIELSSVSAGFSNPVLDAQSCYRRLLSCMSRPGQIEQAPPAVGKCPGLMPGTVSIALTLFDADTRVWFSPSCRTRAVLSYLRFHTGCPVVASPADADFAIVGAAPELPRLDAFFAGTVEYPDQSTTLIIQTPGGFNPADAKTAIARGPGIDGAIQIRIAELTMDFFTDWSESRENFPLGNDLIFVAGENILAVPRSTRLEVK